MLPVAYRINIAAPFPAQALGANGISVVKNNGVYTVTTNYPSLSQVGYPAVPAQKLLKVFDTVTGIYNTIALSSLPGGSGGAGSGNVVGPVVSIDGDVALFSGTSGTVLKDGGKLAAVGLSGMYSDLIGKPTLGTAAALNVGTAANNVVQLDATAKLPAVDGSQLTGLPTGSGNVSGPTTAVDSHVALYAGTTGKVIKDGGALGTAAMLNVGSAANNIVQLDSASRLPAVDGSQLLNLPGGGTGGGDLSGPSSAVDQDVAIFSGTSGKIVRDSGIKLGGAASLNVGTTAGTVAAGNDGRIIGAAQVANNLSDLASIPAARTNLGLGNSATLNVGTAASTVAGGNDSRILGAAQTANNLSDLASAPTARTNLGLGGAATLSVGTAAGTVAAGNDSRITGAVQQAATSTISTGYTLTPKNLGTIPASFTPDPTQGNYQFGSNNAAITVNAPTADCAIDILFTNGASAVIPTFAGGAFKVGSNTGDAYVATNAFMFILSIRRINAISTYAWKALQ